eukprot:TRINITY_DN13021_c0_g1_i1.p1 TRINITY_DN13021_c0_g1~~TRINITY_DN13021_c0_g1_i1.p1  ORF type:complete len:292 (-),score=1.63 TRINITY_DN13021_c0_g1_i1:99-974(-)
MLGNHSAPYVRNTTAPTPVCHSPNENALQISLGAFLIVGTFISYVPQGISIFRNKSSEGVSFFSLALGFLSGFLSLLNLCMLDWFSSLTCCSQIQLSLGNCLVLNLSIMQLCVGPICFCTLYILFLVYFPKTVQPETIFKGRDYLVALIVFMLLFVIFLVLVGVALLLYFIEGVSSKHMALYADACGIASSIITLFIWMPQIWTTFKLKDAGSLSIPMLALQILGAGLVVYFQIGYGSGYTTWGPYVVNAIEELVLIIMCLVYYMRNRKLKKLKLLATLHENEHLMNTSIQ